MTSAAFFNVPVGIAACPSLSMPCPRPLCERRKFLHDNMVEIPNRILFSEMKHVTVSPECPYHPDPAPPALGFLFYD